MKYAPRKPSRHFSLSAPAWLRVLGKARAASPLPPGWLSVAPALMGGLLNSMLWRLQSASFSARLAATEIRAPVFILGFWRSGTSFLHELLACDPRHGFPSTHACLHPFHFLLSEAGIFSRPELLREIRRPMDEMRISLSSPQEDEFALLSLGAPSPYQMLLFPALARDLPGLLDFDRLSGEAQTEWKNAARRLFGMFALSQAGRRMIFKSPSHGFRLRVLNEMFPDARFVLISRNPFEVFSSNMKMWRAMLGLYSRQQFGEEDIENFVLEAFKMHDRMLSRAREAIPAERFFPLRYEHLVADPIEALRLAYGHLGLGDLAPAEAALKAYLGKVAGHACNPVRVTPAQAKRIQAEWGEIIVRQGYGKDFLPETR